MGILKPSQWGPVKYTQTTATPAPEPMEQEFDEVGRGYSLCPDLGKQPYESGKPTDDEVRYPSTKARANLLSSLCKDGLHRPVLDLDMQASEYEGGVLIEHKLNSYDFDYLKEVCEDLVGVEVGSDSDDDPLLRYPVLRFEQGFKLLPSSTEGHHHLYVNQPMEWGDFEIFLNVLGEVGILESGYVGASIRRKQTHVRPEGVKKSLDEVE